MMALPNGVTTPAALAEPARDPDAQTMFLDAISAKFDKGVISLQDSLAKAQEKLVSDPSNPQSLAAYQSLLSQYTLYRNAQSNVVKTYKDVDASIIQNLR